MKFSIFLIGLIPSGSNLMAQTPSTMVALGTIAPEFNLKDTISGDWFSFADIKGEKGAYFVVNTISLAAGAEKKWMLVASVNQNHAAVIALSEQIKNDKTL